MLKRVIRSYISIPDSKVRIIDNFYEHFDSINQAKPKLALFYFKNNWNPECSRQLQKQFLDLVENSPFETFICDTNAQAAGERSKKYYCIRHEPTFLFLSDGAEINRVIGGDIEEVKKQMGRVLTFRSTVNWGEMNIRPHNVKWEKYHDDFIEDWNNSTRQESEWGEGTICFSRN